MASKGDIILPAAVLTIMASIAPVTTPPTTVVLTWKNPDFEITNVYNIVAMNVDGINWQTIFDLPNQTNGVVVITSPYPWAMFRVGNQIGP